jgi:hypothetical protein
MKAAAVFLLGVAVGWALRPRRPAGWPVADGGWTYEPMPGAVWTYSGVVPDGAITCDPATWTQR